ncbi:phage tail protein [Morganella psychrotolerans]|uniref:Phage tail protein n=1 Tax=Morganella psychrotolerans TaxID=368603 RepID=A0A1B8HDC8_9GAMM|nr:phage tail protein [Morganella psychrotolerans]OBU07069.1 phage tail protein [Morganella psychrotolerans]
MEIFSWRIRPGMRVTSQPRTRVVRFGDGYEARRSDGFNADLKKYNVMLSLPNLESQKVEQFLGRHAGVITFLWKPPHASQQIRVLCREWSFSTGRIRSEITAEFEETLI